MLADKSVNDNKRRSRSAHVILTFSLVFSFLMLLVQRTERKSRRFVITILIIPGILVIYFINIRDIENEGWAAFLLSLFANFFFWLLIGRYNPIPDSDEMRVLGLDD